MYKRQFLGLTPSRRLRARISAVQRALLRPASSVDADASGALSRGTRTPAYGCLHARIETDMLASWGLNRAGLPPLSEGAARFGEVAGQRSLLARLGKNRGSRPLGSGGYT